MYDYVYKLYVLSIKVIKERILNYIICMCFIKMKQLSNKNIKYSKVTYNYSDVILQAINLVRIKTSL